MKYSLIIFSLLFSGVLFASETAAVETDSEALSGEEVFTTFCADAMVSSGRLPLTEDQTKRLLDYLSEEN